MNDTWINELKCGDKVVVLGSNYRYVGIVAKVTKSQITLTDKSKYWKNNKKRVGDSDLFYPDTIDEPTSALIGKVNDRNMVSLLANIDFNNKLKYYLTPEQIEAINKSITQLFSEENTL